MKIVNYIDTEEELNFIYQPWGGAKYNFNLITKSNKIYDFLDALNELYPDGLELIQLNDILWFEDGFCYQYINDEFLDENEKEQKRRWLD